jgi:hypothetical protein
MVTDNNNNSKNNSFLDRIKKKNPDSDSDSDGDSNFAKKHDKGDSNFASRYQKKPAMTSTKLDDTQAEDEGSKSEKKPIDPKKRALAKYIYLVKGIDANRKAWYYVLVEALKVQLFLKALNDDIIHLEHYGKILYSAYGEEPPAHITKALKDEYDID